MARLTGALVVTAVATSVIAAVASWQRVANPPPLSVVEASITDLRKAMESGQTTSRAITEQYLARISRYGDRRRAAITVNPNALAEADARDRERRERRVKGPLHGIPIALKDNIHTLDMPTTGGALAFAGLKPPYEATLTRQLLDAGAVIIAKTTLTELANWVSSSMPPGYNALLGFSINPYAPPGTPEDVRSPLHPGGSSSGIGTAASLWAANVGTETSGSILNPANQNLLVGIKPTVGRISRYGVIPISADQDTPGPLTRTVTDAAILLGALEGSKPDPNDPATRACSPPSRGDYTRFLRRDGLRSARIGIVRTPFSRSGPPVSGFPRLDDTQQRAFDEAVDVLKRGGATVIDPADLPSLVASQPDEDLGNWRICNGRADVTRSPATCSIVLRYGMKRDFNQWLASLGSAAPVKTLTELLSWNTAHRGEGALRFGQDQLEVSDAIDLDADRARYESDRAKDLALTRTTGIDAALQANRLDALIFPGFFGASISARAGYPTIIVPFMTAAAVPGEPAVPRSPLGISFTGTACSEPRLIELAYAFEQATARRVPPSLY